MGTKAAYLSRGGPVCPEAGLSVPGGTGAAPNVPMGTKAAYLSRGGPVHPEAGLSVPGGTAAAPNYRDNRDYRASPGTTKTTNRDYQAVSGDASPLLGSDTFDHEGAQAKALHPKPLTLHPEPQTLNSEFSNPQPSTTNPKP